MHPTVLPALSGLNSITGNAEAKASDAKTNEEELRKAAQDFEATFIAEMLTFAGFDEAVSQQSGFGGEAYSRFLIDSYAQEIAKTGSFGIAEKNLSTTQG